MTDDFGFEFDDSEDMDELMRNFGEPDEKNKKKKRKKPRKLDDGPNTLDMSTIDDMDSLLAQEETEAAEPAKPRPPPPPELPLDLFEDLTAESMEELIAQQREPAETIHGTVKEITIETAIVNLGDDRQGRIPKDEFSDWSAVDIGDDVLVQRKLNDPGPIYNLRLLKFQPKERNRSISKTTEVEESSIRFRPGDCFVIDGSNICRSSVKGKGSSLTALLTLVLELQKHQASCVCVFDANERYVLGENRDEPDSERIYDRLINHLSHTFREAPGASNADDYLLKIAHRERLPVISRDRFDKASDRHREQYPWLVTGGSRLLRWQAEHGLVQVPKLGLIAPLRDDLWPMFEELKRD